MRQCDPRQQGLLTLPVGTGRILVISLCFSWHGFEVFFFHSLFLCKKERNYVLERARVLAHFKWPGVPIVTSGALQGVAKVSELEMS